MASDDTRGAKRPSRGEDEEARKKAYYTKQRNDAEHRGDQKTVDKIYGKLGRVAPNVKGGKVTPNKLSARQDEVLKDRAKYPKPGTKGKQKAGVSSALSDTGNLDTGIAVAGSLLAPEAAGGALAKAAPRMAGRMAGAMKSPELMARGAGRMFGKAKNFAQGLVRKGEDALAEGRHARTIKRVDEAADRASKIAKDAPRPNASQAAKAVGKAAGKGAKSAAKQKAGKTVKDAVAPKKSSNPDFEAAKAKSPRREGETKSDHNKRVHREMMAAKPKAAKAPKAEAAAKPKAAEVTHPLEGLWAESRAARARANGGVPKRSAVSVKRDTTAVLKGKAKGTMYKGRTPGEAQKGKMHGNMTKAISKAEKPESAPKPARTPRPARTPSPPEVKERRAAEMAAWKKANPPKAGEKSSDYNSRALREERKSRKASGGPKAKN